MLANLMTDVRYCVRGFTLRPGFVTVVVLTLAFGIGVNVAVFSLYDRLLLRELPVSHPEELVNLAAPGPRLGFAFTNSQGPTESAFSYPMFRDLEAAPESPFAGLAGARLVPTHLGLAGRTAPGTALLVSGGYFETLGLGPALGRLLDERDDRVPGEAASAVVSHDYWTRALGSDPAVVGKTILVNGRPLEIVGVAPPGFTGTTVGQRPEVFVPLTFEWIELPGMPPLAENRFGFWLYVSARLKPGVSAADAEAAINVPYRRIVNEVEAPLLTRAPVDQLERFRASAITLAPGGRGQSSVARTASGPLAMLFGTGAAILLLACVNLANLMFARGASRVGEVAVRLSMGAGPRRLFGMLAVEALTLAGLAAVLSLPTAYGVLKGIAALGPEYLTSGGEIELNLRAVAAALAIAAVSSVAFALAPLLKLARTDPAAVLQASGARASGDKGVGRFRFTLATVQIALSLALLVVAGLFAQSLANIARIDLGLRTESLLTFTVAPALSGYPPERAQQLFDALERELGAQPGVTAVTTSALRLLSGEGMSLGLAVEGYEPPPGGATPTAFDWVGADFLDTFGIPLLAGRSIEESDSAGRPKVAIVNESFAAKYGLGPNPVGKRVSLNANGPLDVEIVGVFKDSAFNLVKVPPAPLILMPRRQNPSAGGENLAFYVRTSQAPEQLLDAIPEIVASLDANVPATNIETLATQVRENVQTDWLLTTLSTGLAAVATLLAAIGLYGVLSYTVALRTREIGVRLALGAEPAAVRRMVLKQVAWMAVLGVPLGIGAALLLGRLAAALLYGLAPTDPAAFGAAAALLAAVLLGASYVPARRASKVDPVIALRSE